MAKDSVKKRLEGETGISFTEFTYQLIQGYDFYWLYKNNHCKLQMGGSDQWGNITTGTELIRRKSWRGSFCLYLPTINKSRWRQIWQNRKRKYLAGSEKTTPYQFYQFWLNASDADAANWIKIFTFLSQEEINDLVSRHNDNSSPHACYRKQLAKHVTIFVHGIDAYNKAIETTEKLFASQNASAESLNEQDLEEMEGVIKIYLPRSYLSDEKDVVSFLTEANIFPSKGEARKMVQNGGVSVNRNKVSAIEMKIGSSFLLHNKFMLVQKGKKNYYLVTFS